MKKIYPTLGLILFCLVANAQWAPVGSGVNSSVDALNIYNGQLVAAGRYSSMTKWDGSAWSDFAPNSNPPATSICVDGMDMYAGGQFTGGDAGKIIQHFDGTAWSVVGGTTAAYTQVSWNTNNRWWSIFKYKGELYGIYDGGMVKFDGTAQQFTAVGDPLTEIGAPPVALRFAGIVNDIALFSGMTNGIQRVITWDDSHWDTLNLSFYPLRGITGMKVVNNELFISGGFQNTNTIVSSLLKWNGTAITEVLAYNSSIPTINALYSTPTHLYAKQYSTVPGIGLWNGSSFTPITGPQFATSGSMEAVAELNGQTYIGGFFTSFDGVTANNIVQRTLSAGIGDLPSNGIFTLYPNPSTEQVELESSTSVRRVIIYNAMGQNCFTTQLLPGQTRVSVAELTAGVYVLQTNDGKDIKSARFIKE